MTITIWISLLTLVVGAIVSLTIAAQHRKQMRQIELHRVDPTVPLVPPAHPSTQFLKRHSAPIVGIVLNLGFLIEESLSTGPVMRPQVFRIAFYMTLIFFWVTVEIVQYFIKLVTTGVTERFQSRDELMSKVIDLLEKKANR